MGRIVAIIAGASVCAAGATADTLSFDDVLLNGEQVVIPRDPDPPSGTDSDAIGFANFVVDLDAETFSFDLDVDGIFIGELSGRAGNDTAIHVHRGGPLERGPIIIDLHWYALNQPNGLLVDTDDGFMLHAEGAITSVQGNEDTELTVPEILDFIAGDRSFVMVHDVEYPSGAIRGNFVVVPTPATAVMLGVGGLAATRRRRCGMAG